MLGMLFGGLYRTSPERAVNVKKFQKQLERKEKKAFSTILALREMLQKATPDSLIAYPFPDDDISYYVIENDKLVFWSDNSLDISAVNVYDFKDWHYVRLPNACCVVLSREYDGKTLVALITIKYNYSYENNKLVNRFARGFDMDERIAVVEGCKQDEYAVFCSAGHYLFSLEKPNSPVYAEYWAVLSSVAYALFLIIAFVLYARIPLWLGRKSVSLPCFLCLLVGGGLLVGALLYFGIPTTLFSNQLFSPFVYSAGDFLATICHLSVLTGFCLAVVCMFFFYVDIEKQKSIVGVILLFSYPVCFLLLYGGLYSLIFHSTIKLDVLNIHDFSWAGFWALFLLLLWGGMLALTFYKVHRQFVLQHRQKTALAIDGSVMLLGTIFGLLFNKMSLFLIVLSYSLVTTGFYAGYLWNKKSKAVCLLLPTVLYAAFVVLNVVVLRVERDKGKYRVLAQNVSVNGNVENDRVADLLLEELDERLIADRRIAGLALQSDSLYMLKEYLDENYFRGFWNKYDVQLAVAASSSELFDEYRTYIRQVGSKIAHTHFYSVPFNQNSMTYIGMFRVDETLLDSVYYFMEFYPRRQYKSYSFPNLLIPASADIYKQLNVSVAKYDNEGLVYFSGTTDYPTDTDWLPEMADGKDYVTAVYGNQWHYIYKPAADDMYIVISKQVRNNMLAHLQFFVYLSFIYFLLAYLLLRIGRYALNLDEFRWGLAARFQYTFIFLLILCFSGVFYFSIDFIKKRYHTEQVKNLENKRAYIQNALQNMYYWNQGLDASNTTSLNFDLQELSYIYQTDIHVFDNDGLLLGSSQPLIFYRNLISNRMAPQPYFSTHPDIEQHEHIGDLDYLVAYTDFYNGDYLQIGYIAVPQFLSEENMRVEIENFSSVIVHIYLFVILLAILLTVIVGKRLSAPLNILEHKLKEMRIGRRNEKIDYHYNDEIGQLVAQYNRTVDELEQSVRLLAQSERESAWKSMARQVAHEINNPLTPMKLSVQQLQRRKDMNDEGFDEYFRQTTGMLVEQIDNLSRIAGTFSDFARMPEAKFAQVDAVATLKVAVHLFANNKEQVDVCYTGVDRSVYVFADAEQFAQVCNNLIKNAIQSIPKGRAGRVNVSLRQQEKDVVIEIEDNGKGISREVQDKIFMPNFTTKAQGMGLGLAISKKIVEQFGGSISFRTEETVGSVFVLRLPEM